MRQPDQYALAVHYSFVFATAYYAAVGVVGYHAFGASMQESFTVNLALAGTAPASQYLAVISAGLFVMKLQAGFPLYAAPVLAAFGCGSTFPHGTLTARSVHGAFAIISSG